MASESTFNAPGSTFSQLNGRGGSFNPNTDTATQIDSTSSINNSTSQSEESAGKYNEDYKKTRSTQYEDPTIRANENTGKIKNPDSVNFNPTTDTEISTKPKGKDNDSREVEVIESKKSRESSNSEQGWIERQAMGMINDKTSQAGSEVKDSNGVGPKDPDTSTKKSKKTTVGKVPAIDASRPSPSIPDANKRPTPGVPNISKGPNPTSPKLSVPKFSMPKMKLR